MQLTRFAKITDPAISNIARENINVVSTFTPVVTRCPTLAPRRAWRRFEFFVPLAY